MKTTTKTAKASRTDDRSAFTDLEVRDMNRVAKLLSKLGAVSIEHAAKKTKQSIASTGWCLYQLGAISPGSSGLYVEAVVS